MAITYLHHTHPDVHHYDPDSWTFVKGALATVDRDFGFIDRHIFHGIIGTHVAHHLFPYAFFFPMPAFFRFPFSVFPSRYNFVFSNHVL